MSLKASRAAIALLAVGAVALAGCSDRNSDTASQASVGSGTPTSAAASSKPLDANGLPKVEILQEAVKATRETYSEHLVLDVARAIKGLPVLSVDGDITSDKDAKTVASQGTANVRIDQNFVQTRFVVVNGVLYANLVGDRYQSMGRAGEKGVYDPSILLDMDKGLPNIVSSVQNPKVESRETANGLKTVKVSGSVTPQVLDPLLPQITEVASKGNAGTSLPIELWIVDDPDANPQPRPNVTRMQVKLKDGNITLDLTDFGKKVDVSKPAT